VPEPGQQLLHYRLIEKIGEGGMGVVWKAEDTKLHRDVALKLLPDKLAADPERRARFEREAQAIAALNHPGVVTIHSVEQAEDLFFISMEYVEGKPLSALISKDGMASNEMFSVAIQVAEAIAVAHERGITHRDLKPDNVMIGSDGRVKVLDFGLAKLADGTATDGRLDATGMATATVTSHGRIVGTVNYMSPEQAEGQPVDARSDVFSLGILLYEMATGRRPFSGDTPISTISAIIKDTPISLTELKQTLPRHLDRIVHRCLSKDPDRRYETAKGLRNDLEELKREIDSGEIGFPGTAPPVTAKGKRRWWIPVALTLAVLALAGFIAVTRKGAGGDGAIERIAVLPIQDLSGSDQVFVDGVHDALITALAQADVATVVSRSSVMRYRDTSEKTIDIARELDVQAVIEGTAFRSGDRMRINVQMVEPKTLRHLWTQSYERDVQDVLSVQGEVVQAIANELAPVLGAEPQSGGP